MDTLRFEVQVHQQPDGSYLLRCPSLGCLASARTLEEAFARLTALMDEAADRREAAEDPELVPWWRT
ncbi:MAG: hypothetical protein HY683_05665 [Chloroflexi bacterium]|nr:hypothetical protein [Chloroflexota bacterium]